MAKTPYPHNLVNNDPNNLTKLMFQEVFDCGFNVCMEGVGDSMLNRILELIDGTGVKFMVASSALHEENYRAFVEKYKDNPNVCGCDYKDEPRYGDLVTVEGRYNMLRSINPTKMFLITLVGSPGSDYIGPNSYGEYLDLIQTKFHPGVWCYDMYPMSIENGIDVINYKSRKLFYGDFEHFSAISKKTQRPFWAFCQSMSFKNGAVERPAPKEAYLRYEAFSALAYGAQGIIYWTYAQRNNTENETYFTALIDKDGNKTPYWYYAQTVNKEIKQFTDVFLGCELDRVGHVGNITEVDCFGYSDFGPLSLTDSPDEGAMITLISNGDKNYLVIVNHSPLRKNQIQIKFKSNTLIRLLTTRLGNPSESFEKPSIRPQGLLLQPGDYIIYEYKFT